MLGIRIQCSRVSIFDSAGGNCLSINCISWLNLEVISLDQHHSTNMDPCLFKIEPLSVLEKYDKGALRENELVIQIAQIIVCK